MGCSTLGSRPAACLDPGASPATRAPRELALQRLLATDAKAFQQGMYKGLHEDVIFLQSLFKHVYKFSNLLHARLLLLMLRSRPWRCLYIINLHRL